MKGSPWLRTWAGPLTIGSFGVVAATGALMFFHMNSGLMKLAHEWLGWVLVLAVAAHLILNWKPFVAYFSKPSGIAIMGAFLAMGVLSFAPTGGERSRPPVMETLKALEQSSLQVVSQVAKTSPEALIEDLRARGILVRDGEQTLHEIAADNKIGSMEILKRVFGNSERPRSDRSRG